MRSFTTDDGFVLRIFSTLYLDWGLEILDPSGESVYYNPHCIASDCVGFYNEDEDGRVEYIDDYGDDDDGTYYDSENDNI